VQVIRVRKFLRDAKSLLVEFQSFIGQLVLTTAALYGLIQFVIWLLR
jgi:hypothetical protein